MRTFSGLLLLLFLLPAALGAPRTSPPEDREFVVTFPTSAPLGLKLDASLRVVGFHRNPAGNAKMPAEESGWLRAGDTLVAVNDVATTGKSLSAATAMVSGAETPRRLSFLPAGGADRAAEMAAIATGPSGVRGHEGTLEIATNAGGVGLGGVPFLQAMFGGQTSCKSAPIVFADPPHGCGSYKNTNAVFNAIVVVERGLCTFSDKAAIAQGASAVGLIVLNEADNLYARMPIDSTESQRLDLTLPVVMIDSGPPAETLRVMLTGSPARRTEAGRGGNPPAPPPGGARGGGSASGKQPPSTSSVLSAHAQSRSTLYGGEDGTPTRILGGIQGRLVRTGLSCKPWRKSAVVGEAAANAAAGVGKGGGRGGKGGEGGAAAAALVGDPAAPSGELLLFKQGVPLGGVRAPVTPEATEAASAKALKEGRERGGDHAGHNEPALVIDEEEAAWDAAAGGTTVVGGKAPLPRGVAVDESSGLPLSKSARAMTGGTRSERAMEAARIERRAMDAAAAEEELSAMKAAHGGVEASGEENELATQADVEAAKLLARARAGSSGRLEYLRASFCPPMPQGRLRLVLAEPRDACSTLKRGPGIPSYEGAAVLVERGTCGFSAKAGVISAGGGAAMILINSEAGMFSMGGEGTLAAIASSVSRFAPSIMVTQAGGAALKELINEAAAAAVAATIPGDVTTRRGDGGSATLGGGISSSHTHGGAAPAPGAHPELWPEATVSFLGNALYAAPWEELQGIMDPSAWPSDASARKKLYLRLSRIHHPDRSTGGQDRFELMAFLYKRANHHYDPASEPGFVNDMAAGFGH